MCINRVLFRLIVFLVFSGIAFGVEIRITGNIVSLKGENYSLHLSKENGRLLSVSSGGGEETGLSGKSLWQARFLDGTSEEAGPGTLKLEDDRVIYSFQTPELNVTVSVVPGKKSVDFLAEAEPLKKTLVEFSTPGRIVFSPDELKGLICHVSHPRNVGLRLNDRFFRNQKMLGQKGSLKKRLVGPLPYRALFKGDAYMPKFSPHRIHSLGDRKDLLEWMDPETIESLKRLRFSDIRPFGENQVEFSFIRDKDNGLTAFGASRLGGKGAIIRFGGTPTDFAHGPILTQAMTGIIRKLKRENRLNGRTKIYMVRIPSGAFTFPHQADWLKAMRSVAPELKLIESPEEMAKAVRDPETAVILNPWRECCFSAPDVPLEKFIHEVRSYICNGGYWFECGGYSFYYEIQTAEYLNLGKTSSPGAYADFFHFDMKNGSLALYAVQPRTYKPFAGRKDHGAIFIPSVFDVGGDESGGFVERAFGGYWKPGKKQVFPVLRILFEQNPIASAFGFAKDNQAKRPLSGKIRPELLNTLKRSVICLADQPPHNQTANQLLKALNFLPSPIVIHIARYLHGGFDKQYPDHLPPNQEWGSIEDFGRVIRACHERGMLFMPYVNNTWWCDRPKGPTFLKFGDAALQRGADGKPQGEFYGNNIGWTTTMWHPHVRMANETLIRQFTEEHPVDLLFQDQCGGRAYYALDRRTPRYDFNPASPTPYAATEGILSTVETDARRIPLMTEEGWWGIQNSEVMMCGFSHGLIRFWFRTMQLDSFYSPSVWNIFPLVQAIGHDTTLMSHHNSADIRTPGRLAWTLAFGFHITAHYPADPAGLQWLRWLDSVQKSVVSRYSGKPLKEWKHLWGEHGEPGLMKAVYGDVSILANMTGASRTEGPFTLANDGFLVQAPGLLAAYAEGKNGPFGFIVEKKKGAVYAAPSAEIFLPLPETPKHLHINGEKIVFRKENSGIRFILPSHSAKYFRFWNLGMEF